MSPAGGSWHSVFEDPKNKGTFPETKDTRFSDNTDWDTKWKEWAQTAQRLKDSNGMQQKLKYHKLHSRTVQHLSIAKQAILQLANEQSALATQLQQIKADNKILTNEQLKEKINTALYGENVATENTLSPNKVFDATAGRDRKGNCDGPAKDNKAKTVMAALVCVCARDSSNGIDKACNKHLTLKTQWTSSTAPQNNVMQELRKLFPATGKKQVTAARLASLISNVKAHFTASDTSALIGKLDTGAACSGSANSWLCLKYTDVHQGAENTIDDISWIAALNQIVNDIKDHEESVAAVDSIGRQLSANTEKAGAFIASIEQYTQAQAAVSTTANPKPAQAQENEQNAKNACAQHSSNKTWIDEGCKWAGTSETDEKCTADESKVKEQTNAAGTEAGAAGTTTDKCKGKEQTDRKSPDCK
uniref:Variant surface glycoprotein 1125.2603 n=1 Tax=Trypanosoma brucei TaxID=5691 RepID=A0A1J0R847_9TRYP|nr:variant surface glycoprotein 1125.2603 [Trypanosoma brucei]